MGGDEGAVLPRNPEFPWIALGAEGEDEVLGFERTPRLGADAETTGGPIRLFFARILRQHVLNGLS